MRTSGEFNIHAITINLKSINDRIKIIPFGDIHRDSPSFSNEYWDKFLARAKSCKNAFFFGMGDYMDGYSTSERAIMYADGLHESSRKRHDEDGRGRIRALAKELSFMKGRIIGMLNGNHYQSYQDGTNGDQYLANELHAKYLGVCAAVRICFDITGHKASILLVAHHGRGAGTTAGGRLNSVEKLASYWPEAEIVLMGDNHARGAIPLGDKLTLVSAPRSECGYALKSRKTFIARTGSFLKSYEPGECSYVVDAALPPASLGWVEFDLAFSRGQGGSKNGIDIDITATS